MDGERKFEVIGPDDLGHYEIYFDDELWYISLDELFALRDAILGAIPYD